jgi:hypothetical protein
MQRRTAADVLAPTDLAAEQLAIDPATLPD